MCWVGGGQAIAIPKLPCYHVLAQIAQCPPPKYGGTRITRKGTCVEKLSHCCSLDAHSRGSAVRASTAHTERGPRRHRTNNTLGACLGGNTAVCEVTQTHLVKHTARGHFICSWR